MTKDTRTLEAGNCLQNGKYRIISVLGQGGFGITYLAEQTGLGMKVAIKEFFMKGSCQRDVSTSRVSVPVNDNEELVLRCQKKFKSEARKIASLNNDHIVNIIDVFDENGTSYYVMKYLAGGSLASMQKQSGPVSEAVALKVIGEISDALKSVHSNGLLHLDIKPANILFDERGRAVLIDFGVSKYVDSQQDSSTTSSLIGFSRGFAPLEQVNSTISSLSAATDIYALGATLLNMVTGETPPEASVVMESGLPKMSDGLSKEVKNAITQAMQPRRRDRPQNIDDFLSLLPESATETDNSASEDTVIVAPVSATPPPESNNKKGKVLFSVSSAMLVFAIVMLLFSFINRPTNSINDDKNIRTLKAQVDSLSKSNSSLRKQINNLNTNNDGSKVEELENKVKDLSAKNTSLSKENSRLKKEVDSYKSDAERWRRYLESNK